MNNLMKSTLTKTFTVISVVDGLKQEHSNIVHPRRNETNGTCKFGKIKFWFNHEKKQNVVTIIEKEI